MRQENTLITHTFTTAGTVANNTHTIEKDNKLYLLIKTLLLFPLFVRQRRPSKIIQQTHLEKANVHFQIICYVLPGINYNTTNHTPIHTSFTKASHHRRMAG